MSEQVCCVGCGQPIILTYGPEGTPTFRAMGSVVHGYRHPACADLTLDSEGVCTRCGAPDVHCFCPAVSAPECPSCDGTGSVEGPDAGWYELPCRVCGGDGVSPPVEARCPHNLPLNGPDCVYCRAEHDQSKLCTDQACQRSWPHLDHDDVGPTLVGWLESPPPRGSNGFTRNPPRPGSVVKGEPVYSGVVAWAGVQSNARLTSDRAARELWAALVVESNGYDASSEVGGALFWVVYDVMRRWRDEFGADDAVMTLRDAARGASTPKEDA